MMVAELVAHPNHTGTLMNADSPKTNQQHSHHSQHHQDMEVTNITSLSSQKACHYTNATVLMIRSSSLSPTQSQTSDENMYTKDSSPNTPAGYDRAQAKQRKDIFSQRKQREFIPDSKKDDSYWDRRRRNNEAAKRSREKRRFNDMVLEQRVIELTKENHVLKAQLDAIMDKYNICGENLISVDQIMATMPTSEQVLSITKRLKPNQPGMGSPSKSMMIPGSASSDYDAPQPSSAMNSPVHNKCVIKTGPQFGMSESVPTQSQQQPKTDYPHQVTPLQVRQQQQPQPGAHILFRQNQMSPFEHGGIEHGNRCERDIDMRDCKDDTLYASQQTKPQMCTTPSNLAGVITNSFRPLNPYPVQETQITNVEHQTTTHKYVTDSYCDEPSMVEHQQYHKTKNYPEMEATVASEKDNPKIIPHLQLKILSNGGVPIVAAKKAFKTQPQYNQNMAHHQVEADSVLNLSRRAENGGDNASTGSYSDGHDHDSDVYVNSEYYNDFAHMQNTDRRNSLGGEEVDHDSDIRSSPCISSSANNQGHNNNDQNNSLPLKLRHKSQNFMGDKCDAASALLALHHIKQEPNVCSSEQSPIWDGENSSDERDSGICIEGTTTNTPGGIIRSTNSPEWAPIQKKLNPTNPTHFTQLEHLNLLAHHHHHEKDDPQESNVHHLKPQLARLESEIVIKNMMILNSNSGGATAAAQ